MFLENKYARRYWRIVERARDRLHIKRSFDGFESHHVVPLSIGGVRGATNRVWLTCREHYICHLLLVKMTSGRDRAKMIPALKCMSQMSSPLDSRHVNAKKFSQFREKGNQAISELHHDVRGSNNPMYGVSGPNKGIPMSAEQKEKIAASLRGKPKSDEHRANLRLNHWSKRGHQAWNKRVPDP